MIVKDLWILGMDPSDLLSAKQNLVITSRKLEPTSKTVNPIKVLEMQFYSLKHIQVMTVGIITFKS